MIEIKMMIQEVEEQLHNVFVRLMDAVLYEDVEAEHTYASEYDALEERINALKAELAREVAINNDALYYESLEDRLCGRR